MLALWWEVVAAGNAHGIRRAGVLWWVERHARLGLQKSFITLGGVRHERRWCSRSSKAHTWTISKSWLVACVLKHCVPTGCTSKRWDLLVVGTIWRAKMCWAGIWWSIHHTATTLWLVLHLTRRWGQALTEGSWRRCHKTLVHTHHVGRHVVFHGSHWWNIHSIWTHQVGHVCIVHIVVSLTVSRVILVIKTIILVLWLVIASHVLTAVCRIHITAGFLSSCHTGIFCHVGCQRVTSTKTVATTAGGCGICTCRSWCGRWSLGWLGPKVALPHAVQIWKLWRRLMTLLLALGWASADQGARCDLSWARCLSLWLGDSLLVWEINSRKIKDRKDKV